jgi:hypothetical protein
MTRRRIIRVKPRADELKLATVECCTCDVCLGRCLAWTVFDPACESRTVVGVVVCVGVGLSLCLVSKHDRELVCCCCVRLPQP